MKNNVCQKHQRMRFHADYLSDQVVSSGVYRFMQKMVALIASCSPRAEVIIPVPANQRAVLMNPTQCFMHVSEHVNSS